MTESKEQQLFFIRWAIQLGAKGRVSAPPNPWVGCVIVKEGAILGEGFHESVGKQHAEAMALEKAGVLAKGATAYVSLEPCAHQGRTPPCVQALIGAGIKKVVIPLLDPDPNVSGIGVAALQKAGIEVIIGIGEEEARKSLAPYLYQRTTKLPFCVIKAAMSIDGKTAAVDKSSQWITGEAARADAHLLRAESQAILIGAGTALLDHPRLTVRGILQLNKQPLRILLDSKGIVPTEGPLADTKMAPTLIFTTNAHAQEKWLKCGAEVILQEKINLKNVLVELGRREILQLLIEGGSHTHAAFLKHNLVNQVTLYIGNCLLGEKGMPLIPELTVPSIAAAPRWQLEEVSRFDQDIRLDYKLT